LKNTVLGLVKTAYPNRREREKKESLEGLSAERGETNAFIFKEVQYRLIVTRFYYRFPGPVMIGTYYEN